MKANASTEAAVKEVLYKLAEAYSNRDMNRLLAILSPESDVFMYGTGIDEKRIGLDEIKAQAERDWAQSETSSISYQWMTVSSAGSVAWVAADAIFSGVVGGQEFSIPARMTAVLQNQGNRWLLAQTHFSAPLAGQEEGQSFPD